MQANIDRLLKERKKILKKIDRTERKLAWKNFWYDYFKPDESLLGAVLTLGSIIGVLIFPFLGQFVLAGICLAITIRMATIDDVVGIGIVEDDLERLMKNLTKIQKRLHELGYTDEEIVTVDQEISREDDIQTSKESKLVSDNRIHSVSSETKNTIQSAERLIARMNKNNDKILDKTQQEVHDFRLGLKTVRDYNITELQEETDELHQ